MNLFKRHKHKKVIFKAFFADSGFNKFSTDWICKCGEVGSEWTANYLKTGLTNKQAMWAVQHPYGSLKLDTTTKIEE